MRGWKSTPLAVVVFEAEMRLLKLQLLSVDRLYNLSDISEYAIVINSGNPEPIRVELRRFIQKSLSRELGEKVTILSFEDLVQGERAGYYDQQAIKLALGPYFAAQGQDYYLMLDAKNHFVRSASIADFLEGNRPRAKRSQINGYWMPRVEKAFNALDVTIESAEGMMMPSITPYMINVGAVSGLVQELEARFNTRLLEALKQSQGTEFLLYYAYLVKHGLMGYYADAEVPNVTFFTVHPSTDEAFARLISIIENQRIVTLGLHRNRISKMTEPQRRDIQKVWGKELLFEWENPDWFMTVPER